MVVFTWSIYNGAVYYIDVFGKRFQKELEQLKKEVAKMSMSPELGPKTPTFAGSNHRPSGSNGMGDMTLGAAAVDVSGEKEGSSGTATSTGIEQKDGGSEAHQRGSNSNNA